MPSNDSGISISRRQLLARIGQGAGAALMYQAMSTLGFAAESTYSGPLHLANAPRGTSILILGAGIAGLVAAYELQSRRLQGQGARIQPPRRRSRVDAARRRRIHRIGWLQAEVRIRQGPVYQSWPMAHPLPSLRDARLRQAPQGAARAVQPDQRQRLSAFAQRVRRQAAARASCTHGFSRSRRRAAEQGDQSGPARHRAWQGGQGTTARGAAQLGLARQTVPLRHLGIDQRRARL